MSTTTTDYEWHTRHRIARAIDEAPLSKAEIAEQLGISPRTLTNWLTGESQPSIADMHLLAQVTGAPIERLLIGYVKRPAGRRPSRGQGTPGSPCNSTLPATPGASPTRQGTRPATRRRPPRGTSRPATSRPGAR